MQIADAVLDQTRKHGAQVALEDFHLGRSRGERTLTIRANPGWNASRRSSPSSIGTRFETEGALERHAEVDQAALRQVVRDGLEAWARKQHGDVTEVPAQELFLRNTQPGHCNSRCLEPDCIDGKVICTACRGSCSVRCYSACDHGRLRCHQCFGEGTVTRTCTGCHGRGTTERMRMEQSWDPVSSTNHTRYITEHVTCHSCFGNPNRREPCPSCLQGMVVCGGCNGLGTVGCAHCSQRGKIDCRGCSGSGYTSVVYLPYVRIDVETATARIDPEDAPAAALWDDSALVEAEAQAVGTQRVVEGFTLTARTALEIPYARGKATIDDIQVPILAAGAAYCVRDMHGILAQVMDDDVRDLEAALPGERGDAIRRLLSSKFGSEAVAMHAAGAHVNSDLEDGEFRTRVGRALDAETRALLIRAHGRGLRIAAGAAFTAALLAPVLNHWVSRNVPVELSVLLATAAVALWTERGLRRDGPLGSREGAGVIKALLGRHRLQRVLWWGYGGIAAVAITCAVQLSYWLADRAAGT